MLSSTQINVLESKNIFKFLKDKSEELYNKWKMIADCYRKTLDRGPYFTDTAYTPHDFENHCMDIYKILDDLILKEKLGGTINYEEIFVLLVAVILHDIIMAYEPAERETHSEKAFEYVLEQVYTKNSSILKNCLTRNQAMAVAYVILGHSDLKKDEKINTLSFLPFKGEQPKGSLGEINVRTLAAILRLADELDVTNERVQGIDINLYKINGTSEQFWNQCNLFRAIRPYSDNTTIIKLEVDDYAYKLNGDSINDIKRIRNVKNKIQEELNNVTKILYEPGYYDGWTLSRIEISASPEILELLQQDENIDPFEDENQGEEKKKL